ncbi:D-hexose-6-phosphate mutarotase [Thalassotalea litorea]|uniref:D-hexose-6-phosphate mutarotase n=1 Tax=Thalassotalea litorea TaxID=2020715 RepID=UPI003736E4C5
MIDSIVVPNSSYGSVKENIVNKQSTVLDITHPGFHAKVSLFGGQVLSWQPQGQQPVLWCSDDSPLDGSKAIRGGIPVCWPWFGDFQGQGNHGFARNNTWLLQDVEYQPDHITLVLSLSGQQLSPVWPGSFTIEQRLRFADTLTQTMTVTNNSQQQFSFTHALHSYFSVSSPSNVRLPEVNLAWFDDKIIEVQGCKPQELKNIEGPVDRVYHLDKTVTLVDKGLKRIIEISKFNSAQWIVWNPGEDLANTMTDIHDGGEQEFVCVEAGNTSWTKVDPGETVTFGQEIKVYNL